MKVSVIIPCLNGADTIGIQLEELANQQLPELLEVIVSDNGSTDETIAVVQQYKERLPNLCIVEAKAKKGAAYTRNTGIRVASGDAFLFIDADDKIAPGWLSAMTKALLEHDLVTGSIDLKYLNEPWRVKKDVELKGLHQPAHPPFLAWGGSCNMGFTRSLYQTIGGFDESVIQLEDTEFCWRSQLAGFNLYYEPQATVHYRLRHTLRATYQQSRSWAEAYLFLLNKYGQPISIIFKMKLLLSFRHILVDLVKIYSKTERFNFAQRLGWRVGEIQGCIKYLL
jgi:glycosyltransferase involved in cell wall biosynthesis